MAGQPRFCDECGAKLGPNNGKHWRSCSAAEVDLRGSDQANDQGINLITLWFWISTQPTWRIILGVFALVVVVIIVLADTSSGTENPKPPNIPATREAAEERQKGFHCMSTWDGNHDGLEDLIKAKLKDPDSMETIETKITPVDANGNHTVILKYRARNSFGGMVVEQALGIVDNDTCEATLLGVE